MTPLLDHGLVRLVSSMGDSLSVVRAARVSYDAAWRAGEDQGSDKRLINYLWKNHHTTPFEAVTFTFEVKAPIFVFRQWHRHRTWSFNELSARYRELPSEFYVPEKFGVQATDNKQGRVEDERSDAENKMLQRMVRVQCENAFNTYRELLNHGVPRELARSVLPVNTYSHMFATVDLLNLLKFLTLRCDAHAQYEIRVYADAMRELVRPIVSDVIEAWESKQVWTKEIDETIREELANGLSFADVARVVNEKHKTSFTRNAVLGRASRQGMRSQRTQVNNKAEERK